MDWKKTTILITGGTGSFGKKFVEVMLRKYSPRKLIIFSRDELKQYEMQQHYLGEETLRFFIGDVRDRNRVKRALSGVDVVVHAAAMKQVPACEYNPFEAVLTNIDGSRNVIEAAIDAGVKKAVLVSTDKAVNPVNLYGGTKLCAEKIFVHGNSYSGAYGTLFSVVRYGNVIGSRGSVLPTFLEQSKTGTLTVTDDRMTRFWIGLEQGVEFVIRSINNMRGGEIFVPRIPSMRIVDLARAVAPEANLKVIGIRPGEKIHEVLVSEDEARHTLAWDDHFVIYAHKPKSNGQAVGRMVPAGFTYCSGTNERFLSPDEFLAMMRQYPEFRMNGVGDSSFTVTGAQS